MTFEQPTSLNRFVADPVPLTWASRWKYIRIFLPLLVFMTICFAERIGFLLWKHDKLKLSFLLLAFLPSGFLLVILLILGEIRLRGASGNAARMLNVLDNGISFRAVGRPLIRWPKVVAFWFEDIPGEPQLSKVTMEYFGDRKTTFPRRESLVLEKRNQYPALLSELKLLQQQHNLNFRIELNQPLPPRKPPRNLMLGMSLYLAGVLFLMPGMPLLLVPLMHRPGESQHSESTDDWSPKQKEKLDRFLIAHFSSKTELKHFMLELGGVLTTISIALMIWGTVVQRPKPEETLPTSKPKSKRRQSADIAVTIERWKRYKQTKVENGTDARI
jgi:hypothetical protein